MKKIFIAIAFCAMSLIACNKQQIDTNIDSSSKQAVIRAVGENYDLVGQDGVTKATINTSKQIEWAAGDKIGVRLYKGSAITGTDPGSSYGAWDATFTLDAADAGKTNGSFTCPTATDEWLKAYAAWYPRYEDSDQTNIGGDAKLYFYLRSWYDGYTSGTCWMPMMADMSSWSESNTDISFKHVGAGIRVTLKDVPGAANQASITVPGKNIAGWFTVDNPNTAGTAALSAGTGTDNNTVYLKFDTAASKRDMTFIFPLPTVDLSGGITIKLYYDTDHKEFWSRSASNVNVSLGRGEVLDMPDITVNKDPEGDVTLYFGIIPTGFDAIKFCSPSMGTTAGWPGTELTETEVIMGTTYYKFVTSAASVWGKSLTDLHIYGVDSTDGDWATAATTGDFTTPKNAYYFTVATKYDAFTQLPKRPTPPAPVPINIDGDMSDWATCTTGSSNATNNYREFKATYDENYLYLYTKRVTVSGQRYIYYDFDLDNDSSTGDAEGSRTGLEAYMALVLYDGDSIVLNPGADSYYPDANVYANLVCKGTVGTEFSETELSIPRTNLGINKGDVIKIYSWGNKSADGLASHPITLYIEK